MFSARKKKTHPRPVPLSCGRAKGVCGRLALGR